VGICRALDEIAYAVLWAFVFIIPWEEVGLALGGRPLVDWVGLLAIGIVATRMIVLRRCRKLSPLHLWMLALVAWSALSILWTSDPSSTATRAETYVLLLTMVWLIWETAVAEERIVGLLQAYVLGALIASAGTIYNFLNGHTAAQMREAKGVNAWETFRYSMGDFNENDLGLVLALSLPIVFYLLASRRRPLVKALSWLQLVAGFTSILLTASRGALLAATPALIMFVLIAARLPRRQRYTAPIVGVGLIASSAYLVPQSTWSRIFTLGTELSTGTLTHRTVLWAAGLETFRDHALLGVGAGAYGPSIQKLVDSPLVAHNTFLAVLVELGVVGASLLLALLASILYCAARMRYLERCLWITLLLTWAIGASALSWEYRKPTWLLLALAAAHAYSRRPNQPKTNYFVGADQAIP
jgi:O-antigen ligase